MPEPVATPCGARTSIETTLGSAAAAIAATEPSGRSTWVVPAACCGSAASAGRAGVRESSSA
jgi:hypothetical protein